MMNQLGFLNLTSLLVKVSVPFRFLLNLGFEGF